MRRYVPIALLVLLAVTVVACNSPLVPSFLRGGRATPMVRATAPRALPTARSNIVMTPASAVTVAAPGAAVTATLTVTPTLVVRPGDVVTPTIAAGVAVTGTATVDPSACTDQARMVRDVTIPDNTAVARGQGFVKTWRLRNSGTCTWDPTYDIIFASGEQMGAPESVALPASVPPGGTVDISVNFTAPDKAGTFKSNWKMRNAEDKEFGISPSPDGTFWVQILVR